MPAGRPSSYSPETAQEIINLMGQGYSLTAAAASLNLHRDTIYGWKEKHPEISDIIKMGHGKRAFKLETDLLSAKDGPTVTSRIFALKNAAPDEWRDRVVNEHVGKDGGAIETKDLSAKEIARELIFLLAKARAESPRVIEHLEVEE